MAGIYVHIPFCKSRCIYCGFYSTTLTALCQAYIDAVCREWTLRRDYINEQVRTIYVGGGTPSVLPPDSLLQLFDVLGGADEVTVECNPDDVTPELAALLRRLPVNRVSMGAQTFNDSLLRFLGRRHTARQVRQAVDLLRSSGTDNISIDLMYGFPGETLGDWEADIDAALSLQVEHLSAYSLTYEESTPLERLLKQGDITPLDEETERTMFYELSDRLTREGYEHYEISNFARPGRRSQHNSNYWNQTPYIGLGAAAHSFDGSSRQWNVADVKAYMEGVARGEPLFEREEIDLHTRYNDMVMTALRTADGLCLALLDAAHRDYCLRMAERYLADGLLRLDAGTLRLSREGLFVSEMVMAEMMWV